MESPDLSLCQVGPVTVTPGARPLVATSAARGWQAVALHAAHADAAGLPSAAHVGWLRENLGGDAPPPDGEPPLGVVWRNAVLGDVDARLRVFAPLYVEGLIRSARARAAFDDAHRDAHRKGAPLRGAPRDAAELAAALTLPGWGAPQDAAALAVIQEALLWGLLDAALREASQRAPLGLPPPCDWPADLSPLRADEELPALAGGAVVYYRPAFLNSLADRYFSVFAPGGAARVRWERRTIRVYGREAREGHDTAHYGDPGTSYRYSGKDHMPQPWSDDPSGALAELLWAVRVATGVPFNYVLMNHYRPGDSIGRHSDDERGLDPAAGIFSVSLGRPRLFCLEPRGGAAAPAALRLAHGSALWMRGATQQAYTHHVPPEKMRAGEAGPADRVNLTFRRVRV